jgi:hypothetical protein
MPINQVSGRERILARLWEIADMDPERTRNSMSAQIKAIAMIVAIEGVIPDRRAGSARSKSAPSPVSQPSSAGSSAGSSAPDSSESAFAKNLKPSGTTPPAPHPAVFVSTPGIKVPFSFEADPFARRPWSL